MASTILDELELLRRSLERPELHKDTFISASKSSMYDEKSALDEAEVIFR